MGCYKGSLKIGKFYGLSTLLTQRFAIWALSYKIKIMARFIIVLLIMLPLASFAQQSSRLTLEASYSTLLPTGRAEINTSEYTGFTENTASNEHHRFINHSGGLLATFAVGDAVSIGSGLSYAQRSYQMSCYCDVCDKVVLIIDTLQFHFLEVPLFFQITPFSKERLINLQYFPELY